MAREGLDEKLYVLVEYRNPQKGNRTHLIRSPSAAVLADGYDNYGMGKSGKMLKVRVEDAKARPDLFVPIQQKAQALTGATMPKSASKGDALVNVPEDDDNDANTDDSGGEVVVAPKPVKAQEDTLLKTETDKIHLTDEKPRSSGRGGTGHKSDKG